MFGNILSLYDTENFANITTIGDFNFRGLFSGDSGLVSVKGLILPLSALSPSCYERLFSGCSSLKDCVTLPAMTLNENCYAGMFENCTSLTKVPELPATTLAKDCYEDMFKQCYSLKTGPRVLPAEEILQSSYYWMFQNCESLIYAPKILAKRRSQDVSNYSSVLSYMFDGCTSLKSVTVPFLTPSGWTQSNLSYWLPSENKGIYKISSSIVDEN